ncbi:hypothetical protein ACA910_007918 [Epithemia clementina (nom. ined.)]
MPQQRIARQSALGDAAMVAMITTKLEDVPGKGYVHAHPPIKAMMNYFAVLKGDTDVRMVYDGTKSGLNECLYAPWFFLPDLDALARTLDKGFWCIDNDYGEMFLNFWLHPELEQYSGMDLTPLYRRRHDGSLWIETWSRCLMGQSPSPFVTTQQTRRLKRLILRDAQDHSNVFQWDYVKLNLPGTPAYQPGEPWISKQCNDGCLASDAHDYVDDLHGTAATMEEAWQEGARIAKTKAFKMLHENNASNHSDQG